MRRLLVLAALLSVLATSGNAMAQCCDGADLDNNSSTPNQACDAPAPGALAGCMDVPGAACFGGRLDGPGGPEGCVCVAGYFGYCFVGDRPASPSECATAAAAACCKADACS